MSSTNDELILKSIENYNVINNQGSGKKDYDSLQKQLITYKLQYKILSDLLREVLNGDAADYEEEGELNPLLIHPLVNQLVDGFTNFLNDKRIESQIAETKQEPAEASLRGGIESAAKKEPSLKKQLQAARNEKNLATKIQSLVRIFNLVLIQLNQDWSSMGQLFVAQEEKVSYLQYLISQHSKESEQIFQILQNQQSVDQEKQLKQLMSDTQKHDEALVQKDREIASLRAQLIEMEQLRVVHGEINRKQVSDLENKLKRANQKLFQKNLIIQQSNQQLPDTYSSQETNQEDDRSINEESVKIHELNEKLEAISTKHIQTFKDKESSNISVQSNFEGRNLLENNLVETINILNHKLLEKNVIIDKLNNTIMHVNSTNGNLLSEKLAADRNLVTMTNNYNAVSSKFQHLETSAETAVTKFIELLALDIKSFKQLTKLFTKIVDETSLTQAREKLTKLIGYYGRQKKSLNFVKIIHLTETIHHYFNSAVETLVTEHVSLTLDSGLKQKSDSSIIRTLTAKSERLSKENESLKAEIERYAIELEKHQRPMLLLGNSENRTASLASSDPFYANNNHHGGNSSNGVSSPRSKARIEELTKRLKSEREQRVLENKASQKRLDELEEENDYLRGVHMGTFGPKMER